MIFYSIILATLINQIAFKGSKVLMSLFAMRLGADPFLVGVLISLYSLFPLFIAVYAGRLSDRFGPRVPMLLGSLGLTGGLVLPFLLPRLPILLAAAAIIGCLYIFYTVSVQHLIGSFGDGEQRTRNFGTFSLGVAVSSMLGPLLTGFVIDLAGHRPTYLILALFPLAPAVFLFLQGRQLPSEKAEMRQEEKETLDLLRNQPLRRALLTTGIIETGLELFNFYIPIYGHSLGLSASVIGIIMGSFAAAMLIMRSILPILVRKSSEEKTLVGSLGLAAVACMFFPFVTHVSLLVATSFVFGLGLGSCSPLSLIITYNRAPAGRSGEAMGLRQSVNKFIQVLLPVVVGTLGAAFGVGPAFWMNAFLLAGGACIMRADVRLQAKQ